MTAHNHTEFTPGCYRCELSDDEAWAAAMATADDVINVLRKHLLPFCSTADGDLPGEVDLHFSLTQGPTWYEWTIDVMSRDWKLDREPNGELSVRYRGSNPDAFTASLVCNVELADLA